MAHPQLHSTLSLHTSRDVLITKFKGIAIFVAELDFPNVKHDFAIVMQRSSSCDWTTKFNKRDVSGRTDQSLSRRSDTVLHGSGWMASHRVVEGVGATSRLSVLRAR